MLADKKKHVYDEDIAALVDDSLIKEDNVIKLKSLKVYAELEEVADKLSNKLDMVLQSHRLTTQIFSQN